MKIMQYYHRVKDNNTRQGPRMVSWDITNRCNLSCLHCLNRSGDGSFHNFNHELSRERQLRIAHEIAELHPEQCCLCGGETLLNPNIYEIIDIIASSGVIVNMVSNGLLLDEEVLRKLLASGIYGVQISVDGLGYQHDIFRNRVGAFDKAVNAVKMVVNAGINSMVSFCPNKLNYKSFPLYVTYIKSLGCKHIRSMPFLPIGRGGTNGAHLLMSSNEMFEFVNTFYKEKNEHINMNLEWGDPLEHLMLILLNKRKYPIIMGISSIGELTVTPYVPITVGKVSDDKTLKDIWDNGYNEIWAERELLDIIRNISGIYDLERLSSMDYNFNMI